MKVEFSKSGGCLLIFSAIGNGENNGATNQYITLKRSDV